MKRRIISLLLVGAMAVGLTACGGGSNGSSSAASSGSTGSSSSAASGSSSAASSSSGASSGAETTGEKIVYTNTAPEDFFEVPWFNCGEYVDHKVLFETLIGTDANFEPTTDSGMCESYELSEDGLTLTLKLRDGLKWHDGQDVTAEDVQWSMETLATITSSAKEMIKSTVQSIEGYQECADGTAEHFSGITTDGNTVTLKFAKVAPNVLISFAQLAILPKHCLEKADKTQFQQDPFWQNPIGSGPFKVGKVEIGNYATYVPFEDYWNGVADFTIQAYASSAESDANIVKNAKDGKVDYAFTKSYADVQALQGTEGINIITVPVLYTRWLQLNEYPKAEGETGTFADKRVRQAVAYAIDRKQICESIFEGACDPGDGTLLPTGTAMKNENCEKYEYDPEKAKALLDEAGWDSSQTLKMVYYYQDEQTKDLVSILQQMLAQVGINIEAELVTGDTAAVLNVPPTSKDANGISGVKWDICYGALAAMSPTDYYNRFGSTDPANYCTPATEELDGLLEELNSTVDTDKQKEIAADIEAYQAENMLYVPLYYQPAWVIASDKIIDNVETWGNPQYFWNWDIQNWELK